MTPVALALGTAFLSGGATTAAMKNVLGPLGLPRSVVTTTLALAFYAEAGIEVFSRGLLLYLDFNAENSSKKMLASIPSNHKKTLAIVGVMIVNELIALPAYALSSASREVSSENTAALIATGSYFAVATFSAFFAFQLRIAIRNLKRLSQLSQASESGESFNKPALIKAVLGSFLAVLLQMIFILDAIQSGYSASNAVYNFMGKSVVNALAIIAMPTLLPRLVTTYCAENYFYLAGERLPIELSHHNSLLSVAANLFFYSTAFLHLSLLPGALFISFVRMMAGEFTLSAEVIIPVVVALLFTASFIFSEYNLVVRIAKENLHHFIGGTLHELIAEDDFVVASSGNAEASDEKAAVELTDFEEIKPGSRNITTAGTFSSNAAVVNNRLLKDSVTHEAKIKI